MIALCSELSRRAAEKAIADGRISVNGQPQTTPGTIVDPSTDYVALDGVQLSFKRKTFYLAFHKPRLMLVTKSDPQNRTTIWDDLKQWKGMLNSVGRLDYDSEGLILLTNDGDFINRLTHPKHEIWKTYRVRVKGIPDHKTMQLLKDGVDLKDGKTLPAKVKRVDLGDENALIEISIREGRNRQVRRMFEALRFTVVRLKRMGIGSVKLGRLKPGEWRFLRPDEVAGF